MAKVSVIVPSRNEPYLIPTINDVLAKAAGDCEVVVVLEDFGRKDITPTGSDWSKVQAKHGARLTTIYHNNARGMRPSINEAVASAISRGSKYLMKLDAHCMVDEGWDEKLIANCDKDWVVVPRRKRLAPDTWTLVDAGKPDIDYHYLSFPDDPNDFGGPGLNGKVWYERTKARLGILLDDEMSSQGSGWFMHADYFQFLELMDHANYGPFWNEFQEIGLKTWLSGGQVKVNKHTWYAHWHKGKAGRGYRMPEQWLREGRNYTMNWIWNEAWAKQTRPFEWIIDHFWPVPTWNENWREVLYASRKPRMVGVGSISSDMDNSGNGLPAKESMLTIHSAYYGIGDGEHIHVTDKVRSLVTNGSLDLMVGNSVLGVGNPFRGQKKKLWITYSYDGGEPVTVEKDERDWLIIGQSDRYQPVSTPAVLETPVRQDEVAEVPEVSGGETQVKQSSATVLDDLPDWTKWPVEVQVQLRDELRNLTKGRGLSPQALNDLLIRKFRIPSHRLRGPMPIEVPNFHRNDLASLFAELGFNKGVEVGVAEANFSEILCKANPQLNLLCVDPWHAYSGNPQNKSKEKNEYAHNEAKRKLAPYPNVKLDMRLSMDAVRDVPEGSLDFAYVDGHHSYPFVMSDLIEWTKRVRSGGIVAGDDVYRLNEKWGAGPMEAVYDYTRAMRIEPWFLINAHKSVDFFWVKQ